MQQNENNMLIYQDKKMNSLKGVVGLFYFVILRYGFVMPSRRVRDDCKELHYAKTTVTL